MEGVFTARNTQNITFDQIQNVASSGIFVDGFQTLRQTGVDGLANTAALVALYASAASGAAVAVEQI